MTTKQPHAATRVCMRVNNVFTHDLRVRREAEALAEAGYDVTVVADFKPGMDLAVDETVGGVRVKRIRKTSRVPYWSIIRPLLDEHADIYHGHDIDSLLPAVMAAKLSRRKTRVVYDSHELWSGHAADKIHAKRRMLVRNEGLLMRGADALITASPAYTETIVERYGFSKLTQTILNVPRMYPDEELQQYWDARDADVEVKIIYVSVFQHGRGAIPLIRSLEYLPEEFVLELVGPIAQPEYETLMREAAAPFGDRVRFAGQIPSSEVVTRLARGHISAVPIEPLSQSYRFTAPNKLFDSMMAGTPMVASDMRVIGAVVRGERAGAVCEVDDPADIARAVHDAYDNRVEYRRNCRAAASRYNWDAEKAKLLELYRRLLEG